MGLTYGYVLGAALHVAGVALTACTAGDSDGARSDGKDEGECTNEHDDGVCWMETARMETLCDLGVRPGERARFYTLSG